MVITATPAATSELQSWGGDCTSTTATTCTVTLGTPTTAVTATFKYKDVLTGNPSPLAFGDQAVDSYSDLRTITIQNPSAFATGTLAVTLEGANAAEFELVNNNCNTALAAMNGSCTFAVFFKPGPAGGKSTTAKITASPGGTLNVPLTGNSLAYRPVVFYSPSSPAINPPGSLEGGPQQVETVQEGSFVYYTNRIGGPGGWDIWASYSNFGSRPWSDPAPISIGGVNTVADEINPFMPNGQSLYFVRNSGGYTIQQARWVDHSPPFPDGWECCIAGPSGASPSVTGDQLVLYYVVPGSPPTLMRATRSTSDSTWNMPPEVVPLPGNYAFGWARVTADERGLLLGNPHAGTPVQVAQLWRSSTSVSWGSLPVSAIKGIPALSAASNLDPGFGSDGILVSVGGDLAYSSLY
ncbi:MAG: choice-of-anchor D domain-containing protein [Deltaproteobacteria bacterium]|nr:choice-of-anchor D domain-containing protein [Deltaproteobacteria bacterium]